MSKVVVNSFDGSDFVSTLTDTQTTLAGLASTSAKIRYLAAEGHTRGEISRILEIRYQHVRNVLITPVKRT